MQRSFNSQTCQIPKKYATHQHKKKGINEKKSKNFPLRTEKTGVVDATLDQAKSTPPYGYKNHKYTCILFYWATSKRKL